MKTKVKIETDVVITHVRIVVPVRYEEEDIPNDFPLRVGDVWDATVNIDTGDVANWPQGRSGKLSMKVCDEGVYTLLNENQTVAVINQDYVPHGVVPGEFGDYIKLDIDASGKVVNWPKRPDVSEWFPDKD